MVRYEVQNRIATVTLDRAEKRNALNFELVASLRETLHRAASDTDVRVVILTGEGRVFSAGADLAAIEALQTATPMENAADSEHLGGLFEEIYLHPKPIIAKVNGHAIAGGCGLAAVCDFSIAANHAKLGLTETRIGFVPAIVMVFILRKLGEAAAKDLMLTGRLIMASEAAQMGLISQSVPSGDLDHVILELASSIARETSSSAVMLTKRMIAQIPGMGLREALAYATSINAFARSTTDCQAGIKAFLSKTDPPWKSNH